MTSVAFMNAENRDTNRNCGALPPPADGCYQH